MGIVETKKDLGRTPQMRIPHFKAGLVPQLEKAVREENLQAAARAEAARALKAARRPPAPSEAMSEEVFRNLGSLICFPLI